MVVGHSLRLRGFLTFSVLRVLGVLGVLVHQDVDASGGTRVIHKRVGDAVELSPPNAKNGVIELASWKLGTRTIAATYSTVTPPQFTGRVDFNQVNFSLTVRELTVQDSGEFLFVSAVGGKQEKTFAITLQVHEPPLLRIVNFTLEATNLSCTVLLECKSNADRSATYNWTTRNQVTTGSKLQYFNTPQGEETNFTCMISNGFIQKSALMVWTCGNQTSREVAVNVVLIGSVAGGCLLLIIIVVIGAVICFRSARGKRSATTSGDQDNNLYDNILDGKPKQINTVYDVLQLNRNVPASSYQEVL